MEPMDPLDRKLAEINGRIETLGRQYRSLDVLFERTNGLGARIARLERRDVQGSADPSAALALLGRALVILGRMMQGEDGVHN